MHTSTPHIDTELYGLFQGGPHMVYHKSDVILRGDFPADRLYYIESGYVKAYSLNDRGEEYVHLLYGPGDIFPLIGLINNTVRDIFYESLDTAQLFSYQKDSLHELLETHPTLTKEMLHQSLRQLTIYGDRLDNLEYKYTQERLAYRIILLISRFGEHQRSTNRYIVAIPLSQQVLASSINASRESVNRELERMARKGIITYNRHTIVVNNFDALIKLLPGKLNFDVWEAITQSNGVVRAVNHT
ncbi:MAG TPA: Crp/Fnr family transcriptional regulator [Candidatus Saccharimonadales bacterium]|nr:Crp/Fnr family transcriptional regulator [Candidatus Saccharimonadales bacterium]